MRVIDGETATLEIAREAVARMYALYAMTRQGCLCRRALEVVSAAVAASAGSITRTTSFVEGAVAARALHRQPPFRSARDFPLMKRRPLSLLRKLFRSFAASESDGAKRIGFPKTAMVI